MSVNATGKVPAPKAPELLTRVGPEPIEPGHYLRWVQRPESGAVAQFCGTVRNHNRGARVIQLEYDAYAEMAEQVISDIMQEARLRWGFRCAAAVHRTGPLGLGDVAVCVTVSSDHRDAALEACTYIIDRLKEKAPIWKRETLQSGERRWIEESRPDRVGEEN